MEQQSQIQSKQQQQTQLIDFKDSSQSFQCKHMNEINPSKDPKLQGESFFKTLRDLDFKCHFCESKAPTVWICLNQNCYVCTCQLNQYTHMQRHCKESIGHSIFINPQTTQILCIQCKKEILDFEQYCLTGNEEYFQNWCNPKRIRDIFINNYSEYANQIQQTILGSNLTNPKSHWKDNKGLVSLTNISNNSFMNAIFQIFSNIPIIRKVFKKITQMFGKYNDSVPKSLQKRVSFFFAKLLQHVWSGVNRQIKPLELILIFYQMEPSFRGYSFKDPYEFYKFFVNTLHEDLKFFNLKIFDMRKEPVQTTQYLEEWSQIDNMKEFTDFSIIQQTIKGKLCARVCCVKCNSVFWCEEDFMGVSIDIPKPSKESKMKLIEWGVIKKEAKKPQQKQNLFGKIFSKSQQKQQQQQQQGTETGNSNNNIQESDYEFSQEELSCVTLYECLINFCESQSLSEPDFFSCDSCETLVQISKSYSFLTLPNILTLQLQRFNDKQGRKNITNVQIPLHLELNYFLRSVDIYDQEQTEYELIGVIEHKKSQGGDQYITYAKNCKKKMFYAFYDNNSNKNMDLNQNLNQNNEQTGGVKLIPNMEEHLKTIQPYLVFYKLIQKDEESLTRNLKSQVKLLKNQEIQMPPQELSYLPCFWYNNYINSAKPGMILSQHLICNHLKIKPDYFDCFPPKSVLLRNKSSSQSSMNNSLNGINQSQQSGGLNESTSMMDNSMSIDFNINNNEDELETHYALDFLKNQSTIVPKAIHEYLLEKYGGGPLISTDMNICTKCIQIARQIRRRKKLEKELIAKYDNQITEESYLVEEGWMIQWKEYLYSNKKFFKRNFIKGIPPPKQIQNKKLLSSKNELLKGLKKNEHFRIVNDFIWQIFKKLYGASPALVVNDIQNPKMKKLAKKGQKLDSQDLEIIQEMILLVDENKQKQVMDNILQDQGITNSK